MIQEAYVSYEVAKMLKEKGFDIPCCHYYEDNKITNNSLLPGVWNKEEDLLSAPTHQMAVAWLSVKGIDITVKPEFSTEAEPRVDFFIGYYSEIYVIEKAVFVEEITLKVEEEYGFAPYDSYEEAVEAALKYALENLI